MPTTYGLDKRINPLNLDAIGGPTVRVTFSSVEFLNLILRLVTPWLFHKT